MSAFPCFVPAAPRTGPDRANEGIWGGTLDRKAGRADIVESGVPIGRREN